MSHFELHLSAIQFFVSSYPVLYIILSYFFNLYFTRYTNYTFLLLNVHIFGFACELQPVRPQSSFNYPEIDATQLLFICLLYNTLLGPWLFFLFFLLIFRSDDQLWEQDFVRVNILGHRNGGHTTTIEDSHCGATLRFFTRGNAFSFFL